jgi:nucleotide-binding universal stress UspA family protein
VPTYNEERLAMHRITKILAPVDFSESSRAALDRALVFAESFNAPIEVLHVWEVPQTVRPDLLVWMEGSDGKPVGEIVADEATRQMDEFLARLSPEQRARVKARLVDGDPVDTILELAKSERFDLIVMGTHGRRGLSHLLIGSVAEKVVRQSSCPVLTVRVREEKK